MMTRDLLRTLFLALSLAALAAPAGAAEPGPEDRARLEKERSEAREALRDATRRLREVERKMMEDRRVERIERLRIGDRAMLGVTIDDSDEARETDGARLAGVSPGGPGAGAGLRAGDVILSLDGKSLKADRDGRPFEKLRAALDAHKPGDKVALKVRRDGKTLDFSVTTEALGARSFAFAFGDELGGLAELWTPGPEAMVRAMPFLHRFSRVWGDLEMVSLSERLGAYFGTRQGVLVVRAPQSAGVALQDGDVILSVGEREAESPEQVMRVLRSYAAGEKVRLEVMRDRKRITVEGEVPDDRVGLLEGVPAAPLAPLAPVPALAPRPTPAPRLPHRI